MPRKIIILLALVIATIVQKEALSQQLRLKIAGPEGNVSYHLPHRNIFIGSDSIVVNGLGLIRNQDYAIDYTDGILLFSQKWKSSDTAFIYYSVAPFNLPERIIYLPLQSTAVATSINNTEHLADTSWILKNDSSWKNPANEGVMLGGSKSISISVGSGRDISLDQALEISINGRLSPGLEVNAVLSDQTMPLSATGVTRELSQIDKVYLQAKGHNWETVLGDHDIDYYGTSFFRINRQLQGAFASFFENSHRVDASTATTQGQSTRLSFLGTEGLQGPYKLIASGLQLGAQILPGSERVWLDGTDMKRGELQDYLIDYQNSTITFNPTRPIHGDSRIMVEFEYAGGSYNRTFYSVSVETKITDAISLKGGYLQEGDDRDKPLWGNLSESDRQWLSLAGDDSGKLWVDGGTVVDSGQGDYFWRDSAYVYAGRGSGDRLVIFTWVGAGNGDYRDSLGIFVYAGPKGGEYSAVKRLAAPSLYKLYTVGTTLGWKGGGTILEGAGCDYDRNLFSSDDDADNRGLGGKATLYWKRDSLRYGGLEFKAVLTELGMNFDRSLLPSDPGFVERWDLSGWKDALYTGQQQLKKSRELTFSVGPTRSKFYGEWGRLDLNSGQWCRKYITGLNSQPVSPLGIRYQFKRLYLGNAWANIASQGKREGHKAEAELKWGQWSYLAAGHINKDLIKLEGRKSQAQRYYQGSFKAGWKGSSSSWNGSLTRRDDFFLDSIDGNFRPKSYSLDLNNILRLITASGINSSLTYNYRWLVQKPDSTSNSLNTNLAVVEVGYSKPLTPFRASFNYRLGTSVITQKKETYVLVPATTGDYSYDPITGNFYPDTLGNYIKRIEEADKDIIATEVTAKSYIVYSPSQPGGPRPGDKIKLEFSGNTGLKTSRVVSLPILLFEQTYWWDRDKNITSGVDLSGDVWYYLVPQNYLKLHLHHKRDDDNQFLSHRITRWLREQRLDYVTALGKQARGNLFGEHSESSTLSNELGLESKSIVNKLGAELNDQIGRSTTAGIIPSVAKENLWRITSAFGITDFSFRELSIAPYLNQQIGREGNIRLEYSYGNRSADKMSMNIPIELSYSRPLGITHAWKTSLDYRLNSYLAASLVYDARKEPDRPSTHNAKAEMRAFF